MASSGRAFNEVKAILGKLDRGIDDARTRRTGPSEPPARQPSQARPSQTTPVGDGQPPQTPPTNQPSRRSEYGRAKPLRSDETPSPTGQWDKPEGGKPERTWDDETMIG